MIRAERASTLAMVAVAAVIYHAIVLFVLHVLEPSLSPASAIISDYTTTGSGWLATTTFVAFAVIWGLLAIALSVVPQNRLVFWGRILFGLAVIGILVAVVLPSSADPRTDSVLARVMNLLARPGLFLAVVLVSWGLRRSEDWKDLAPTLLVLSSVVVVLLVVTIAILLERGLGGLGQRALFVCLYLWVILVARRLRRSSLPVGVGTAS